MYVDTLHIQFIVFKLESQQLVSRQFEIVFYCANIFSALLMVVMNDAHCSSISDEKYELYALPSLPLYNGT